MTVENKYAAIDKVVTGTECLSIPKDYKNIFFTKNFIENILKNEGNEKKIIKKRETAFNKLENFKNRKLISTYYNNLEIDENKIINKPISKLNTENFNIILSNEFIKNDNEELKKFINDFLKNNKELGFSMLNFVFSSRGDVSKIEKTFKYFLDNLEKKDKEGFKSFNENKDFFMNLLSDSKIKEFYDTFLVGLNKIDKIKKEHKVDINYNVEPSSSFINIENFLEENNFDPSGNLNKQEFRDSGLDLFQKSSWNRHLVNNKKELLEQTELEKLQKITKVYLNFAKEIGKDKKLRKRLMKEIDLDHRLEDLYFSDLESNSIIRIDATSGDNNAIYELDDFPRGIAFTYLLDIEKKGYSNWTNKIKSCFENPKNETFVFLIHDEASGACKHEHQEMVRFLKEKDGIDVKFLTTTDWESKKEEKNGKYYVDGKEIKGVWHHLMVTKEAGDILPDLHKSGVKILPNFHFSSHKGVQAILWEKHKKGELNKKYESLILDGIFAESIKIEDANKGFSFKGKEYNSLIEFFSDEKNIKNNFKDVVIKIVGAENAEGVNVFATLSKKQVKSKIKDLMNFILNGLSDGETILLQENKAHTVKEELVYNSKTKNYEIFQGNSINRIFLDGKGNFVSGISQITKASKIEENNGKKDGFGTAHGMADMVVQSI